jgi:cephalosporin hydroxylase
VTLNARDFLTEGDVFTQTQEAAFFASIRLRNGTYKTTDHHRLDDLNEMVIGEWKKLGSKPSQIMDVGVSSGISSLEWADALTRAGVEAKILASDLCMRGSLLRLLPGYDVLLDRDGRVLQHIVANRPVRWYLNGPRDFLKGTGFVVAALNALAGALLPLANARWEAKDILLVNPHARDDARLSFADDDILAPNPAQLRRRFNAIRVSNLLNHGYFNDAQLLGAVGNLRDRLVGAGSFLIVNRTLADGTNHGTLFRLNDANEFEAVARLREGSEIESIVLAA